jgi:hypothetical protein
MMNEMLTSDIASADPAMVPTGATTHDLVRRMAAAARQASTDMADARRPWWKRPGTMVPLGIVGALALTGAAVAVPLRLWVNDIPVKLDVEIPIVYTTDTGLEVSCRYGIYFGDPVNRSDADEELAQFVANHDWTGIGQRIYDEAIANPFIPGPNDDWEVDSQDIRDSFSFGRATDLIWAEIPEDLRQTGLSAGGTSDCTGQLR